MDNISDKEHLRLAALKSYDILDSIPDDEFDRLTELAALICHTPISLISLLDEDRQWFKSNTGLDVRETPRKIAFCDVTIQGNDIFEVENSLKDHRFVNNPLVTGNPDIRHYCGCPLIDANGFALGTICVINNEPGKLNEEQRMALKLLAAQAIKLIEDFSQKQNLKQYERLFNLTNDCICVIDNKGGFKKHNASFSNLLALNGHTINNDVHFYQFVHPDEVEYAKSVIALLISNLEPSNFTCRFHAADGTYRFLNWSLNYNSDTNCVFLIGRDISEQKMHDHIVHTVEQKFKAFYENSQGLMYMHDMSGKLFSINNACAQSLGYAKEDLLKLTLFEIIAPHRHDALKLYLKSIAVNGHANNLTHTIHKNGTERIWLYNNVVERNQDGSLYVIGNALDITERHNLEKEYKRLNERLQQTNSIALIGFWELELEDNKLTWSDVTRQIHAVDNNYLPNVEDAIDFYKTDTDKKKIIECINDALNFGKPWDVELQIVNKNGKDVWVRVLGDTYFENNKCTTVFGTFQDITSKKIAELEIAASRNLLRNVLQAASEVSIISTTTEGIITVFNKGAEKLTGYSAAEVIGIHSPAIIHREDEIIARGKELSAQHNTDISGFRVFVHNAELLGSEQREWTYIRKNGSEFTVSLVVTAIRNQNGEILGYLGISTDISERKKAELELIDQKAKLSAFVSHIPAAVAMLDTDLQYIAYSNRWLEEYKLPNNDITGIAHYEVFPNISDEWKQIHKRCLKGEIIRNEEDVWCPIGWQHDQYLRWEIRPWFRHDNTIGGIMMMTQDITDVCLQREELKKAKVVAEQANKAKSEFLSNMSHEIRTPLNGVIGFTDLILKTQLTETQHHYLTIVNQSANGLLSIINDILDFSKIEAGKLELDITKCNLYELTAQAIDIISYQVQNKRLEMLLNVATDLPGYLWTDNIRLKQVLVNLLGNSLKFTEKGEVELKVDQLPIPPDKEGKIVIRFEVRDTGIGIPKDKQEIIFEAFSQEDASTTRKYGGTGLGLTISNRLLQLMGSKLQLISAPGQGSTFFFDIRVRTEIGGIEPPHAIASIKKVLIVDDNDHNRTILSHMLAYNEILTDEAKNGFDAMQLLASGAKYDVILMDYHMPYMDGLETIKKIRESFGKQGEDQSFILLHSSSDDDIIIKACSELHITHRLLKPIKFHEIYDLLSKTTIEASSVEPLVKTKQVNKKNALRVMVVEDNPINMLLAKAIIKKIVPDSTITEASNGQDAVAQCTIQLPDIIFMDVLMPLMNGYDATRLIREKHPHNRIPIIALTAGVVQGEKEKCIEAGMDGFVSKPFVEEDLLPIFNSLENITTTNTVLNANKVSEPEAKFSLANLAETLGIDISDTESIKQTLDVILEEMERSKSHLVSEGILGNIKQINQAGHKLYGSSSLLGLHSLAKMSRQLEYFVLDDDNASVLSALIADAVAEIDACLTAVRNSYPVS